MEILLLLLLTQAAAFTTPSHDELCRAQAAPGCLQVLKEIHLERIVEELSFSAPERYSKFVADGGSGQLEVKVDVEDIDKAIGSMLKQEDLSRFVL